MCCPVWARMGCVHMELDIKPTTELGWVELGWATAHKQSPFLPMGKWEEQLKKE